MYESRGLESVAATTPGEEPVAASAPEPAAATPSFSYQGVEILNAEEEEEEEDDDEAVLD